VIKLSRIGIIIIIAVFLISTGLLNAQGQFLRGEKWKKFSVAGKKADFYISPKGNDNWSGKLASPNAAKSDGPFKTIIRAQKAVKELKKSVYTEEEIPVQEAYIGSPHKLGDGRDILVLIREGYYTLDEPLQFSPDDGGERYETNLPSGAFEYHKLKDHYVTYAAFPGENPVLSGGKRITSWKKENKIWVAKVSDLDVKNFVVNGEMQTLARTPNDGYFTFPEAPENTQTFKFCPGDLKQWPEMQDNRVVMYLRWHLGVNSIAKIDETESIAYLHHPQDGIIVISPRYYVENVKALLDAPGEWFYDKHTNEVSFIPPDDVMDPNQANIVSPVLSKLIEIKGKRGIPVRNLRFYGLGFEAVNEGGNAISLEYTNKCEIMDSQINAVGGVAVHLGFGCFQTRIMHNRIVQAKGGAVLIDGNPYPENWADIIRENKVSYNFMDNCGRTVISARDALYTTISYNEIINNRGRTAIYVGGWPNQEEVIDGGYRVEYNHLHHVQAWADDSGAITTAGYTHDSVIRGNLIHHVKAGLFNDNVAIWFDNLSSGWTAENNIFYALDQGEMKLCAANLVDNIYRNNLLIDKPENPPKGMITGFPNFKYKNLKIENITASNNKNFRTGDIIRISSKINNIGDTGIEKVNLYFDGKIIDSKSVALIGNNSGMASFEMTISEPGKHRVTIGSAPVRSFHIQGEPLAVLYDSLVVSSSAIPAGEVLSISARVKKIRDLETIGHAKLYLDNNAVASEPVLFKNNDVRIITFEYKPDAGIYSVRIGNSKSIEVEVYDYESVDISKVELAQYRAARAEPCEISIDQAYNKFRLQTAGTDFFHGEDSYASVFLKEPIEGNFIATVKVVGFGERTHEWYRAGLFTRNDMIKSFDTGAGSKGSVLMFVSPGRAGMNWDEHGDGCMHKASSENHKELGIYPMWIKLIRHGNSFSGYVSYDGKNWTVSHHTQDLPGINEAVHLGIAAGGPDQRVYSVEFEDFKLKIEKEDWKK
jgi:regulation of enolase protein 1 (concanavalin A-like superfamily)